MGLFDKLFKKQKPIVDQGYFKTLTAYAPTFTTFNGSIYESELIRSAIDARARHISKLQVKVAGSAQPKLQSRLNMAPNDFQTWGQFLYRLSTILDMQNTAFIVPVLDEYGSTTGYYPVLPSMCTLVQADGEAWIRYRFLSGENAAMELSRCAIMTKFQYSDDFFGDNNYALRETMNLISMQTQGIEEAVKSSATYRFMAQLNNFSNSTDLAKERKRFSSDNLSSDAEGKNGLLLFPNNYSNIQQIKLSPYTVDADEMDQIKNNVCNYFGVNKRILQNIASGDEWASFYEGAIEPFSIQFSDVMTACTFSPRERAQGSYIMATSNRLQYMSNADKLNVSSQMADRGLMNRDEIRAIWNLPPLPNGQGQAYTIRGEYYLMNEDGTTTKHGDDLTSSGGNNNASEK